MAPTRLTWRFRPIELLGAGATSRVWLAEDRERGGRVALKVAREAGHIATLVQEAERLLLVDSPALTALRDAGRVPVGEQKLPPGAAYVALQWIDGRELDVRDERSARKREQLALIVARDVAAALEELHGVGSAHGDIKPANIVIDEKGGTAHVVDLGLADEADRATPRGGTVRYLAPEVFDTARAGDGRSRDLWALGLVLAELASASVAAAEDPAGAARDAALPASLEPIVTALLAPAPGARPSAAWVRCRALSALGGSEPAKTRIERRHRAVRRAYLGVRRRELSSAARHAEGALGVGGEPGAWLEQAVELSRRVAALTGQPIERAAAPIEPLDALGRSRWLVALIGPAAAAWPPLAVDSDATLAERLLAACEDAEPASFTLPAIEHGQALAEPASDPDPVGIALALGDPGVAPSVLDAAEQLVLGGAPPVLAIALGRALRLRGQLGRALSVLSRVEGPGARLEAAEAARRAGAGELAEELLGVVDVAVCDAPARARLAATRARMLLGRGQPGDALALLEASDVSAATLETRALCEISLGKSTEAGLSLDQARALSDSEEQRARVAGVEGTLAHQLGDAERELEAFSRAAEHAARAGAVLEEATYLTGVAAAATNLGELGRALSASGRATLLFESLGRSAEAARAALARVSVLSVAGAAVEASDAADEAIARARNAGDVRCRAYAHLDLADVLPDDDPEGIEHARRARALLGDAPTDDALRVAARLLRRGERQDVAALDRSGRDSGVGIDARLEWWGARALDESRQDRPVRPDAILAALESLATERAPIAVRGPALAAGAALAARIGDGDATRRLAQASGEAARELLRRAPPELRTSIGGLGWVASVQAPRQSSIAPEQLTDIETLVRALGRRDRLRPLLDQVLDALVLWTGVERGLLLLRAPGDRLVPRAARNLAKSDLQGAQLELSHSLAERALAQREPVVAVDAAGELPEVHASVHALSLRSVLAVPLLARGEALGVVYLDDRVRRGAFGPRELSWVRIVAALAAVAIADARDQLQLRRAARRARRAEARLAETLARREAELDVAERELGRARDARETRFSYSEIVGQSAPLSAMLKLVDRVTLSEVPVLVIGESGSGKELVARAIHDNGPRAGRPFVTENCGAIPESLLESALFGHVRGAFTGASRPRAGLFEVADRGTLLLDEIGEMSLPMQAKLLRVLQDGEIHPVGSERSRRVDVRVIGATHRDLGALVKEGHFRQDLLYRLDVISIRVPPLSERQGDIALLSRHFVDKHAGERKVRISKSALSALSAYGWPGNVRQLENEMRRALVLADDMIDVEHLSPEVLDRGSGGARADGLNVRQRVDALEAELVRTALERTGGNQTRAAELLGLSRFGLQKMMRRLEIQPRAARRRSGP